MSTRGTITRIVLLVAVLWAGFGLGSAHAATPCEATIARFAVEHAQTYGRAYITSITCGDVPGAATGITTNDGAITIEEGAGLERSVAHEIGHAWSLRYVNSQDTWTRYAMIRGFPIDTQLQTLAEDHAETFAYSLGDEWFTSPLVYPAPYAFQNVAGVPSAERLLTLRAAGLLPEFPWRVVGVILPD